MSVTGGGRASGLAPACFCLAQTQHLCGDWTFGPGPELAPGHCCISEVRLLVGCLLPHPGSGAAALQPGPGSAATRVPGTDAHRGTMAGPQVGAKPKHAHMHTHAHTHTRTHMHTHAHTCTHMHTCAHTCSLMRTHRHTHTERCSILLSSLPLGRRDPGTFSTVLHRQELQVKQSLPDPSRVSLVNLPICEAGVFR